MSSYRGDLSQSETDDMESWRSTTCRFCHGSGWRRGEWGGNPSPCGCDEPDPDAEDEE